MYINMHAAQTLVNLFLADISANIISCPIYKLLRDRRVTLNAVRGSLSSLLLPCDALSSPSLVSFRLNILITIHLTIKNKNCDAIYILSSSSKAMGKIT